MAAYEDFLHGAAESPNLPAVLVASDEGALLGSVNVMPTEMTIRPNLSPWMAQLFVTAAARSKGIGQKLIDAAAAHTAALGFTRLYLFTSGTLPTYYRNRGWEDVEYLDRPRTIMRLQVG